MYERRVRGERADQESIPEGRKAVITAQDAHGMASSELQAIPWAAIAEAATDEDAESPTSDCNDPTDEGFDARLRQAIQDVNFSRAYGLAIELSKVFEDLDAAARALMQRALDMFDPENEQVAPVHAQRIIVYVNTLCNIGVDLHDLQLFLAALDEDDCELV